MATRWAQRHSNRSGDSPNPVQEYLGKIGDLLESLASETDQVRQSQVFTDYLSMMGRFHKYSPNNQILIWIQRKDATLVMGYNQWLTMGRQVRQGVGERGIRIFAPAPFKKTVKVTDENGVESEVERKVMWFRVVSVFDIAQTEVIPGKEDKVAIGRRFTEEWRNKQDSNDGDYTAEYAALESAATARSLQINYKDLKEGHYGTAHKGNVDLANNMPSGTKCLVLAHELAHQILHIGDAKGDREISRDTAECEAECVSYVVGQYLGIASASAPDYLAMYRATPETIKASLWAIQKAAKEIINLIESTGETTEEETAA